MDYLIRTWWEHLKWEIAENMLISHCLLQVLSTLPFPGIKSWEMCRTAHSKWREITTLWIHLMDYIFSTIDFPIIKKNFLIYVTYVTYLTYFKLIIPQSVAQKKSQKSIGILHAASRAVIMAVWLHRKSIIVSSSIASSCILPAQVLACLQQKSVGHATICLQIITVQAESVICKKKKKNIQQTFEIHRW